MFDYTLAGMPVRTPSGIGQYLEHTTQGTVLVVMDYGCPPVEFNGDQVFFLPK